ncbi:dihydroorotate dehydrogenase electron transfer subunit [Geobacter sulfurreducens]|uniref:dihydroorotate dehydrogenase electron transfer subunit n=1 Tax=Geobacter sulfurreducens TaxID=35554 RepID=UPI000DBAED5D|nr:dihydroorotate dehydrogenase electron transfer subunit [Geobacter sulfurreducens]BBA70255.1 Dihydroorotate dehydrogenase B (NAD(+)),electron transfer subunit [Geobacter sulfurreducens]
MQFKAMIISNHEVSPGYFRMRMSAPPELADARPGQFIMVRVRDAIDPLLRRPFGIFDVGTVASEFSGCGPQTYVEMLYKVVGKGTATLSTYHHGDHVDLLAPLGTGFDLGDPDEEKILVGGGIGIAPLYYLAKKLVERSRVRFFLGGRTRDDILCVTEFERLGVETYVATDDGTLGDRGFVTDVMERHIRGAAGKRTIYACGPMPMLQAVAGIAERTGVPCQVSLEAYMACGMGACLGCVVKGKEHSDESPDYRCVCKDGPVFAFDQLKWV